MLNENRETIFTGGVTWTSGETATGAKTLTLSATSLHQNGWTTNTHELIISNDVLYATTVDVYKANSIAGSTNYGYFVSVNVPASVTSATVTVGSKNTLVQGLFNGDGALLRFTLTAAVTANFSNNVIIKEIDA